jgi:hypothetical protein
MSKAERKYWFLRGSGVEPPDKQQRQKFQPGDLVPLRWMNKHAAYVMLNEGLRPASCIFNSMHGDFVFIDRIFPSRLCHWSRWSGRGLVQPAHRRFPGTSFVALATSGGQVFALDANAKALNAIDTQGSEVLAPIQAPIPLLGVDIDESARILVNKSGKRHSVVFWSTNGVGFYSGQDKQEIVLKPMPGSSDQAHGNPLAAVMHGDSLYYTTSLGLLCRFDMRAKGQAQVLLGPEVTFGPALPRLRMTAPKGLCMHEISRADHMLDRLTREFASSQVTNIVHHRFLVIVDAATEVAFTVGLNGANPTPLVGPLLERNLSTSPGNLLKQHLPGIEQVLCCGKTDLLLGSKAKEWYHLDSEVGIALDPLSAMSASYS